MVNEFGLPKFLTSIDVVGGITYVGMSDDKREEISDYVVVKTDELIGGSKNYIGHVRNLYGQLHHNDGTFKPNGHNVLGVHMFLEKKSSSEQEN